MAAPRNENIKEKILTATEELLASEKMSDISLADIARQAGIAKGTLYYYYKNKNDLLFDITDKYLGQQYQDLIEWTEDESKDTSLHRLIKYVLQRDVDTANLRLHLFYDAAAGNEELRKRLLERYSDFAKILAQKISERTSDISPEYLAWLLLLLSDGLFIHKTIRDPQVDVDQFIAEAKPIWSGSCHDVFVLFSESSRPASVRTVPTPIIQVKGSWRIRTEATTVIKGSR